MFLAKNSHKHQQPQWDSGWFPGRPWSPYCAPAKTISNFFSREVKSITFLYTEKLSFLCLRSSMNARAFLLFSCFTKRTLFVCLFYKESTVHVKEISHINTLMVDYNERLVHIPSLRGLDCDVHVLTHPRDFRTPSWVMIVMHIQMPCWLRHCFWCLWSTSGHGPPANEFWRSPNIYR